MVFSLALLTTAAWMRFDAAWFGSRESGDYHRWVAGFAPKLATLGLIGFAATGSWYVFGTWSPAVREQMFGGSLIALTLLTAAGPGLPWLILVLKRNAPDGVLVGTAALVAQFGVLAVNAISRQVKQNVSLAPWLELGAETEVQWGPMAMFLITFVLGAVVIGWMLVQTVAAVRRTPAGGHS
jgi:hypothetical protein